MVARRLAGAGTVAEQLDLVAASFDESALVAVRELWIEQSEVVDEGSSNAQIKPKPFKVSGKSFRR